MSFITARGVVCLMVAALSCLSRGTSAGTVCQGPVCEFHLTIRQTRSMSYFSSGASYNVELNGTRLQVAANNLRLAEKNPLVGNVVSPDDVITLDGIPATIIVVNDQFPGPTLEVMEGTEVVVHVTNSMHTEGTSIHWHGMYMKGTPWMDGTAMITQCLIQPRQTFTYRFTATPAGTHWYHSHVANQRMDGLFGMLFVHKNMPQHSYFPLMVQDWYDYGARDRFVENPWAMEFQGTGDRHLDTTLREYAVDGVQTGAISNYTILINGRGRRAGAPLPLEEFTVEPGQKARFRTANVGGEYPLEISVDQHVLFIVASDGYDIISTEVDSFIVEPGETMDFEIVADQTVDNYWVRVRTTRATIGWNPTFMDGKNLEMDAILRYSGADTTAEPTTALADCMQKTTKCRVFNCNFASFGEKYNRECIHYTDVRSGYSQQFLQEEFGVEDEDVEEYFLNFAFAIGSSVNARKFRMPSAPLYQERAVEHYTVPCNDQECDVDGCRCTHILEIPKDKTIQFVLSNLVPAGNPIFAHHPIHLHGTGFAVMKIGYPDSDPETGHWTAPNSDIQCDTDRCARGQWRNGRPTLNSDHPVVKDTMVVPARGYAVVRFRSTNPGFWFAHCHVEQHVTDGMNMVFNVGPGEHPPLPAEFPRCFNYTGSLDPPKPQPDPEQEPEQESEPRPSKEQPPKPECPPSPSPAGDDKKEGMMITTAQMAGIIIGSVVVGGFLAAIPILCLLCLRGDKYSTKA